MALPSTLSELRLPAARHLYKPPHSAYCPRKRGLQVQCLQFTLQPSKCSPYSLFRSLKAHCKRGEKLSLCGQAQGHPLPKVVTKPPNLEQLPSKPWVIVSGLALETPRKGYPPVSSQGKLTHTAATSLQSLDQEHPSKTLGRSRLHACFQYHD